MTNPSKKYWVLFFIFLFVFSLVIISLDSLVIVVRLVELVVVAEEENIFTDWNYRLNYFHVDIRKPEAII